MAQTTLLERHQSNRKTTSLGGAAVPILWKPDSAPEPASAIFDDIFANLAQVVVSNLFGLTVAQATTANLASLSGEQTIDGTLTSATKLLVKDQANPAENGIYTTAAGAWSRHSDMDTWSEVPGRLIVVEGGTANGDTVWLSTADTGGTLGTSNITFALAFGANVWQPLHARLTALKNLSWSSGKLIKTTGSTSAALITISSFVETLLDDAAASNFLTTLGVSAFVQTLLDDAAASNFLTTLGVSAFVQTLLDDAAASNFLTTLGVSAFIQTHLDDADAATSRATLGVPNIAGDTFTGDVSVDRTGGSAGILQIRGESTTQLISQRSSANSTAPQIVSYKTRGTVGSPSVISQNDQVVALLGQAYDGSAARSVYSIAVAVIAATPSSSDMEGRMTMSLCAAGSGSVTEIFRLDHATGMSMFGANPVINASRHPVLRTYTVATVPSAGTTNTRSLIYVSDGTSNKRLAVSDGTNWRFPDGNVVS